MVAIETVPVGRRERSKTELHARILNAALDLFSKRGIESVTVDEIAAAADVGKGTIYNYFQTKEEIIVAFMAKFEQEVQLKVRELDPSLPLSDVLVEFVRMQFRMKEPYHAFVRVFLGQMFLRTTEFLPHMAEIHRLSMPPLEELFRSLQHRGLLRADIDLAEAVSAFVTIHLGLSALWAIEGPPFQATEQAVLRQVKFFCEGVEART